VVKQFFRRRVEVEVPAGQLANRQPLVVLEVEVTALVPRITTGPVPQAPPVKVFQEEMVSLTLSTPQVEVVVPEVLVVQEAAFMLGTVAMDAPRQLPEHVFSMPVVVVVVTMAATQLLITEQIPDPPVTEARVVVEMEDSPPAMPLLKQLRPVQAQPTLVVVVVVPVSPDH
jgi:hypothetical protein